MATGNTVLTLAILPLSLSTFSALVPLSSKRKKEENFDYVLILSYLSKTACIINKMHKHISK